MAKKKLSKDEIFKRNLWARYKITPMMYNLRLGLQGHKCAICKKKQQDEKKRFAVDHNHKSKFCRGLLCAYCNSKLMKYLRDNKNRAVGLVLYLNHAIENDTNWV